MNKAVVLWSGGKDVVLALDTILEEREVELAGLCTTIDPDERRVSMHDVRSSLIEQQADSMNVPLYTCDIGTDTSIDQYRYRLMEAFDYFKSRGITHIVAGDIYLEDVKEWRQELIEEAGLKPLFPLWQQSTHDLMQRFIKGDFQAVVVCTNAKYLDENWLGRTLDQSFIKDLPSIVDPCGEQGEYHTFVFDAPIFTEPIPYEKGSVDKADLSSDGEEDQSFDTIFWYIDLLPSNK